MYAVDTRRVQRPSVAGGFGLLGGQVATRKSQQAGLVEGVGQLRLLRQRVERARLVEPEPADVGPTQRGEVPADAPLVLHLHGIDGAKERFYAFVKEVAPDVFPLLKAALDDGLENGFDDGRKLKGLPKEGPIFLAFTEVPKPGDDEPKFAVVLAVTN